MANRIDKTLDRIQGVLVLLALAATPLVFTTAAYEQFIRPKIVWAETLAILLVFLTGARALFSRRVHLPLHGVNLLLGALLLWNVLMWPLATSRSVAGETVVWLAVVVIISLAWQGWAAGRGRGDVTDDLGGGSAHSPISRILTSTWCFTLASLITALWTIYQDVLVKWGTGLPDWFPRMPLVVNKLGDWRGYLTAGFGNTDHIAAFLAVVYLPAFLLMLHARGKIRAAILLVILWIMSLALILCWSVGNNASLILGALILLVGIGRGRTRYLWRHCRLRLAGWVGGCVLVVLLLVTNNPLNPHRPGIFQEAFSSGRWHEGGPTRGVIWLNAFEMIRQHQLTGVGPGCFTYVYPRMHSEFVPQEPEWQKYQGAYTNAAHNAILQEWAELGPMGPLLLICLVVAAFRALGRGAREGSKVIGWMAWGGIAALAVLCGTAMMTFPLQLPASTLIFFALVSLGEILLSGQNARKARGKFQMPALVMQGESGELVIYTSTHQSSFFTNNSPTRISALAASFFLKKWAATLLLVLWGALCGLWMIHAWKPLASDIIYNRASQARRVRDFKTADQLYKEALALYPNHQDCRSEYSAFLLETGRYQECIDQLEIVFKRLDSGELYLRRAQAYQALGEKGLAARDVEIYRKRNGM